jgi:hypothetical protein
MRSKIIPLQSHDTPPTLKNICELPALMNRALHAVGRELIAQSPAAAALLLRAGSLFGPRETGICKSCSRPRGKRSGGVNAALKRGFSMILKLVAFSVKSITLFSALDFHRPALDIQVMLRPCEMSN